MSSTMVDRPSLMVAAPVIRGVGGAVKFDQWATEYSRSTVRDGGYYEASWRLPLIKSISRAEQLTHYRADPDRAPFSLDEMMGNATQIQQWFETPYLMHHIEERAAGTVSWEGFIYEMDLTLGGLTTRISMENVWNAVRSDYTDTTGNRKPTAWYIEPESIAVFGRKERILDERWVSAAEASAAAQSFLAEHAWPMPEVVEIATTRAPGLFVQALGYVASAQFQYVDTVAADGLTGDISAFVSAIITNDCEFLQVGNIETNTLPRLRQFDRVIRCWDAIKELTNMGDTNDNPWVSTVYNGRLFNYEAADPTPQLYWRGSEQGVTSGTGDINPWLVRPGVMRDMTGIITSARPGSFLQQARDVWVNEVEMSEGRTQPIFKPGGFDPLAIIRAKDQYLDWMERMTDHG